MTPLSNHPLPYLVLSLLCCTQRQNYIDVATGSLGQGLSVSCGMAYCGKYVDKASYRTFCVIGDGESAEGSIWEACSFASYYKLDNLVAIFDVNRLGQVCEFMSHNHSIHVALLFCVLFVCRVKLPHWSIMLVSTKPDWRPSASIRLWWMATALKN